MKAILGPETRKQIQCVLLQMVVICTQCLLSFLPCEPSPLTSDQEEVRLQGKPKYPVSKHEGWALPFQATHTPEYTTQILVQMGHALTCKVKHTNEFLPISCHAVMDRKWPVLLLFKLLLISEQESRDRTKTVKCHKPPGSHFLLWQTKALRIIYMKRYIAVITKDERQPYSSRQHNAKQNS